MLAVAISFAVVIYREKAGGDVYRNAATIPPATIPAATTTAATSQIAATTAAAPSDFMALVLADHKDFPTTEPLSLPLDSLDDSARLIFDEPIYLDPVGDLWITRADALPLGKLLVKPTLPGQVHITRDRVLFAYLTSDTEGHVEQQVVITATGGSGAELLNYTGRIELGTPGRKYRWDRAVWAPRDKDSAIVVPTDTGIAVLRPQQRPIELFQDLRGEEKTAVPEPQFLFDLHGLLAWIPYAKNTFPGSAVARFVDGKWITLDEAHGWPKQIVHLVPLNDGSVQLLVADDEGNVVVESVVLDAGAATSINEAAIIELIKKLADPDVKVRDDGLDKLTQFGPGAWPVLEKLRDAQQPEAQIRIDEILRTKTRATLGPYVLEKGPIEVASRFRDGGALLNAQAGAIGIDQAGNPNAEEIIPAWISITATHSIQLASPFLVEQLTSGDATVDMFGDEWIVTSATIGPSRFLGNHLEPLLRKSERPFSRFIGFDSRGRWLFRHATKDGQTLILDPNLPDATPRLPAWQYPVEGGSVGWTEAGWPVVRLGGAWVIDQNGTRGLEASKEKMVTQLPTTPATTQSSEDVAIGVDEKGGTYFGGQDNLRFRPPREKDSSHDVVWPLPTEARGSSTHPKIFATADRLFLFNEPGRVVRLRCGGDVKVDATFTRNIPNVDDPTRIWLDPAGRIVIAYEQNKLTILFPTGRIPPPIAQRMLARDLQANQPE